MTERKNCISSRLLRCPDEEKAVQENKPFSLTGDYFPKIIVRHDITKRWYNESGVLNIGIVDFLLDDSII